jgi:phosphopantetheinyl transferase (holo-ACP synthase)
VIFPFHLRSLDVYGLKHVPGEELACNANVTVVGERQLRSDVDVRGADGRLWMRLNAWEDLRFDVPNGFQQLIMSSGEVSLSSSLPPATMRLASGVDFAYARVEPPFLPSRAFWKEVWAGCVLTRTERREFHELDIPDSFQIEWLAERTAAKDAVRQLLLRHYQLAVLPADIEIGEDQYGRQTVSGAWLRSIAAQPVVWHACADRRGMAVAALGSDPDRERLGAELRQALLAHSAAEVSL